MHGPAVFIDLTLEDQVKCFKGKKIVCVCLLELKTVAYLTSTLCSLIGFFFFSCLHTQNCFMFLKLCSLFFLIMAKYS